MISLVRPHFFGNEAGACATVFLHDPIRSRPREMLGLQNRWFERSPAIARNPGHLYEFQGKRNWGQRRCVETENETIDPTYGRGDSSDWAVWHCLFPTSLIFCFVAVTMPLAYAGNNSTGVDDGRQQAVASTKQYCTQGYVDSFLIGVLKCSAEQVESICRGARPPPEQSAVDCSVPVDIRPMAGTPYVQFLQLAQASGIDMALHRLYTEQYFLQQVARYCSLLEAQNYSRLLSAADQPPAMPSETSIDRDRLELAILRIGTVSYCRPYTASEQLFEHSYISGIR